MCTAVRLVSAAWRSYGGRLCAHLREGSRRLKISHVCPMESWVVCVCSRSCTWKYRSPSSHYYLYRTLFAKDKESDKGGQRSVN